jgi:acyl-CoA synthetase (AMP-forming)/AMP-acid ligase II
MSETFHTLLAASAHRDGATPALVTADSIVSYEEFHGRTLRLANALGEILKKPGGIAIQIQDSTALLEAFSACAALGRPALPLDPDLPAPFVDGLLADHPVAAIIVSDATPPSAANIPFLNFSVIP